MAYVYIAYVLSKAHCATLILTKTFLQLLLKQPVSNICITITQLLIWLRNKLNTV